MRHIPNMNDQDDVEELNKLNAESWQIDALRMNPDYTFWGPHEDYMWVDKNGGWRSAVIVPTWKEFNWALDELNEVVNFYFSVNRDNHECEACGGSGYNPETKRLSDTFYDFDDTGERWVDKITQDEVDALWDHGRLYDWKRAGVGKPTAAEVNAQGTGVHDAINRWILIETRAKRLGVWGECPRCNGNGVIYDTDVAHLSLTLWVIHPRKGASRGVEITLIEQDDMPAVISYLRNAATRNAQRFGRLPEPEREP
jgi:hypothetical protein